MEFKDYYRIMGVARDASQDEIKRAYRKLARKYHPDVSKAPDAEARFKELGEANAVLKDLEKRAAYDQLGSNWQAGQDFRPPPDWNAGFEFSGDPAGRGEEDGQASEFSDFFEALYGRHFSAGRRGRQAANARGEDHHARVMITLEDSYTGSVRVVTLQRPEAGPDGRVRMLAHQLKVTIPRGIRGGQHIRLAGQGAPGVGEGKAGDLYLEVAFAAHANFRVEQRDVYLDLPVAPWEAALGATVSVPTPSGTVQLKIPAGSSAGGKLRLRGRGLPGLPAGDLYAVLKLVLPPADSESANAFYRQMGEQFPTFNARAGLGV
jgi:curved DNA-binding protein